MREINELHVPVGRPVKLTMGSEDVLHSFYIPAFRVKADVIPGRYNVLWFTADQAGPLSPLLRGVLRHQTLGHDRLGRRRWSRPTFRPGSAAATPADSPAAAGEKLFTDLACITCHRDDAQARAPQLKGVFGHTVHLQGGGTVVADEAYIRESIVNPQAKVVDGFAANHADVSGTGDRGTAAAAHRLRAVAR